MKYVHTFLLSLMYLICLVGIYLVHVWFLPVHVIFYSAMLDALLAVIIAAGIAFSMHRRLSLTGFEVGLLAVVWLLSGYAFSISGPTVLDRSLSFYILEKLQQRGGGIRQDAIAQVLIEEFVPEFHLVDVRLTEQEQSGTIEIVDGCVRLTAWGQRLASVSHFIRANLLARHRLLAGVYTDVLTDPFSMSATGPKGYEC